MPNWVGHDMCHSQELRFGAKHFRKVLTAKRTSSADNFRLLAEASLTLIGAGVN
jgi:hypothetical protein